MPGARRAGQHSGLTAEGHQGGAVRALPQFRSAITSSWRGGRRRQGSAPNRTVSATTLLATIVPRCGIRLQAPRWATSSGPGSRLPVASVRRADGSGSPSLSVRGDHANRDRRAPRGQEAMAGLANWNRQDGDLHGADREAHQHRDPPGRDLQSRAVQDAVVPVRLWTSRNSIAYSPFQSGRWPSDLDARSPKVLISTSTDVELVEAISACRAVRRASSPGSSVPIRLDHQAGWRDGVAREATDQVNSVSWSGSRDRAHRTTAGSPGAAAACATPPL